MKSVQALPKLAFVLLALTACRATPPPPVGMVRPDFALLLSPDVTITAVNEDFSLTGGGDRVTPTNVVEGPSPAGWNAGTLLEYYDAFAALGGMEVRVASSGRDEALYGHLFFFEVYETGNSAVKRVWRVSVPTDKMDAASGGLMSAVYQPYDYPLRKGLNGWQVSWVLFMSDVPFR